MGRKLRQGDPWMPGFRYGALLPPLSLNLIVRDVERSVRFYQAVFDAEVHYYDVDFGAARVGPAEVMLHADHTHEDHPWAPDLSAGMKRSVAGRGELTRSPRSRAASTTAAPISRRNSSEIGRAHV